MARSNKLVVPQCRESLNQMKYEIAQEFGLMPAAQSTTGEDTEFAGELGATSASANGGGHSLNWSAVSTRQAGSVGGEMTRRLVQQAEKHFDLNNM